MISKSEFVKSVLVSVLLILFTFVYSYVHDTPKVVFCNVGQGDSIYIRTSNRTDILIDAGRGTKVLDCIGRYMPIYDRTIELSFLTHPDADHEEGYIEVLKRYTIQHFYITVDGSDKNSRMIRNLSQNKLMKLYQGDLVTIGGAHVDVLWPIKEKVIHNMSTNEYSYILAYHEGGVKVLLTGDIDPLAIHTMLQRCNSECLSHLPADVLKVPHHGSKNGLTAQLLKAVGPDLSVISVGKNSYGHPSQEILTLMDNFNEKYLRTDQVGDIVIDYDDNGWRVR